MLATVPSILNKINTEIRQYEFGKNPAELYDPIKYIMDLGGKRMRPLLTVLSANLFTDDIQKAIKPAIAVEIFHNFTLMHDDLMDNAPLRRGKATVHEKWTPSTAILSGDVMLVKNYDLMMELHDQILRKALIAFNLCAAQVCEGQQLDMNFEQRETVSEAEYIEMIRLKTAVLLGFSLELGGMIGEASDQDKESLKELGINIGIGFQLMDDLLDVFGSQEKFGKQIAGDIVANKKTFLLIKALEKAQGKELETLKKHIQENPTDPEKKIKAITDVYNKLGIKEITEEKINEYFKKGLKNLSGIQAPLYKKHTLKKFIEQLITRDK